MTAVLDKIRGALRGLSDYSKNLGLWLLAATVLFLLWRARRKERQWERAQEAQIEILEKQRNILQRLPPDRAELLDRMLGRVRPPE